MAELSKEYTEILIASLEFFLGRISLKDFQFVLLSHLIITEIEKIKEVTPPKIIGVNYSNKKG